MSTTPIEYRCLHCTAVAFSEGESDGNRIADDTFGSGNTAGWVSVAALGGPGVANHPGKNIFWAGCPECAALPIEERERRNDGLENA